MSYVPQIGEPDDDAVEWIRRNWGSIPDSTKYGGYGMEPMSLRSLIQLEAEAIQRQQPFRNSVIRAIEKATGSRYVREEASIV